MPDLKLVPDVIRIQNIVLIPPTASVRTAVEAMLQRDIGAVLIAERGLLTGIFTERDLVRRVAAHNLDMETTPVSKVMTRDPRTMPPDATAVEALAMMQRHHFRHVPVVDGTDIIGIVSIRDLLAVINEDLAAEVRRYEAMLFRPQA